MTMLALLFNGRTEDSVSTLQRTGENKKKKNNENVGGAGLSCDIPAGT